MNAVRTLHNRVNETTLRAPADASVIAAVILAAASLGLFAILAILVVFIVVLFVVAS